MVLVLLAEVVSDDQRRCHIDEARADAVEETVSEEHPFRHGDERRAETADAQDAGAEEAADAVALVTEHPDETYRQRRARQRDAE